MGSKWVHISQLRSAGARIFKENERRDWNKTYHKAFGNGGGRLGNSNKKAPSLLFPNSLATRNQFDFALPLGPDVSFHMRVKRFKVSYIWSGLGFISADIDPTNHINIILLPGRRGCFWLFLVTKVTGGSQLPRTLFYRLLSALWLATAVDISA
jgi:hypothetical protein